MINCTAQTDKKTEKIKIIVRSADKYLGIKGLGRETVESMLGGLQPDLTEFRVMTTDP